MLKERWDALCIGTPTNTVFAIIEGAYTEPHRKYHTLDHLRTCFAEFDAVKDKLNNPVDVELAIWFHDLVYLIGPKDNEEQSAIDACVCLRHLGCVSHTWSTVHDMILATRHNTVVTNHDTQYLVDIDLAGLGYSWEKFIEYDRQIREEFDAVEPKVFAAGRLGFIDGMLKKERIYYTDYFFNKYEASARANLAKLRAVYENMLKEAK